MEYYQNTIAIPASSLIGTVFTRENYKLLSHRGKINILRRGCRNTPALVEYESMPERFKQDVRDKLGDPNKILKNDLFTSYIEFDNEAHDYFSAFRKPDGKPLDQIKQDEYRANAEIYAAITSFVSEVQGYRRARGGNTKGIWQRVVDAVNNLDSSKYPHSIPGNARSLERKLKKYKTDGYATLIHGGIGNSNPTKIEGDVADWLLATYCLPHKPVVPYLMEMYNEYALENNLPELSESAVNLWLNKPEVKRQWVLARHGKDEYMRLYGHHLKRNREQWFPNAWWAIDGTKLDWVHYYDNTQGMAAKLKIDVTIDVFSEKIIGSSFSETESHVDHFTALKASVKSSGCKPYLFTYDNQSGHKSKRMQILYDKVVATGGTHYPHKAYKKSNPIEQVFNRIQQQVISRFWFSDKQSIQVRNIDNTPNIDFLLANKHKLYTREELAKAWELAVNQWNNGKHPKYKEKTRSEVYSQPAPLKHEVSELDIIEMFWLDENKGSTYRRGGIKLTVANKEYDYEVLDQDNKIDLEFRRRYVGAKFIVRYDPETLNQYVGLYEQTDNGLLFIAYAQPKRSHEVIPILMQDGDKERWNEDYKIADMEYERDLKAVKALQARTGITEESLIEQQDLLIKMGGKLTKDQRSKVEADSFLSGI
ncbi:MAG: hypothetical protein QM503_04710 [Bacteroidota bacterium]